MKKVWTTLAVIGMIGVIVLVLMNNKAKSNAKVAAQSEITSALPITVALVTKSELDEELSLVGTIAANNDVNIASETQGRVKAVNAKVGDFVTAGSTIIHLDDELKQANLISAEANFEKSKADFERTQALWKEKAVTDAQMDAAKLGYKSADAQLITARRQLKDSRISTPISGFLTARSVDVGANVQNNMIIGTVVDISTLKVKVNVGESDVFKLKVGEKVQVSTEVYQGVKFDAKITNIAAKGDEAHTYPVEIALSNSKTSPLKAGMFARVIFTSVQHQKSLTIPREAIVGSVKDAKVYVVEGGNTVKLRNVVAGTESGGLVSILQGLKEGDSIVINGQNNLKDGAAVAVIK